MGKLKLLPGTPGITNLSFNTQIVGIEQEEEGDIVIINRATVFPTHHKGIYKGFEGGENIYIYIHRVLSISLYLSLFLNSVTSYTLLLVFFFKDIAAWPSVVGLNVDEAMMQISKECDGCKSI